MLEANIIKYMYLFGLLTHLLYHKITITHQITWRNYVDTCSCNSFRMSVGVPLPSV